MSSVFIAFMTGAASASGAFIIAEIIRRRWPMIKESVVGEYDPARDGERLDIEQRARG
jgi:hypothetical protein